MKNLTGAGILASARAAASPRDQLAALAAENRWTCETFPGSYTDVFSRDGNAVVVTWYAGQSRRISSAAFRVGGPDGRGAAVAHPTRRAADVNAWITAPGDH